jgi:hypothetical protein
LNIASLFRYEILNNLVNNFYNNLDVFYNFGYNYYTIADTIKLSESFKGFVTYEVAPTLNEEYKSFKVQNVKRNGKTIEKLEIHLDSNNRLFIIKPKQIGNYEINLQYIRASNLHPYTKAYPLQIKFVVVE